jgi:hypothetical protein
LGTQLLNEAMGYSVFGYFLFFEEEDAAKLLDEHVRAQFIYLNAE